MNPRGKAALSISYLSLAVGVYAAHATESVWPYLPLTVIISILALAGLVFSQQRASLPAVLVVIMGVGLSYRVLAFVIPESLIGNDPSAFGVQSQLIADTGSISGITLGFYGDAAIYATFLGENILLLDLPADTVQAVIPIAAAVILPLTAAAVAGRLSPTRRTSLIAALIVVLFAPTIQFAIRPIPLFYSGLVFSTFTLVLISYHNATRRRYLFIFGVLTTVLIVSHKIAVLIAFVVCVTLLAADRGPRQPFDASSSRPIYTLTELLSIGLAIQWLFLTTYVVDALIRIASILGVETVVIADRATAVPFSPSTTYTLIGNGYVFATLGIGGLVWLYLIIFHDHPPTTRLLGVVAVTVGIALPGFVFSAAGGFTRTAIFSAVPVCVLLAVGYGRVTSSRGTVVTGVATFLIAVVLVSQLFAVGAAPDYRDSPRQYLTAGEVEAKHFATDRYSGTVYMDAQYGHTVLDFEAAAASGDSKYQTTVPSEFRDELLTTALTNGTLVDDGYEAVLLRDPGVYRMDDGRWILTWDPAAEMAAQPEYSQTYNNGAAKLFIKDTGEG
ncbi:hypothetical protein [Haloarchaeobius sp. HRN-SO-5]|uniref:hypothetical protein n=1 Tax=Haloarchaeobius sp. HRN-SO-5 TaxID=3446118 RepID=UPI003EB9086A